MMMRRDRNDLTVDRPNFRLHMDGFRRRKAPSKIVLPAGRCRADDGHSSARRGRCRPPSRRGRCRSPARRARLPVAAEAATGSRGPQTDDAGRPLGADEGHRRLRADECRSSDRHRRNTGSTVEHMSRWNELPLRFWRVVYIRMTNLM